MIIEEEDNGFSNSKPEEEYQELKTNDALTNLNTNADGEEPELQENQEEL